MKNLLKKGISTLVVSSLILSSCQSDVMLEPGDVTSTASGIKQVVLSSFTAEVSGDGTIVSITPLSVGADSYQVDFGDDTSTEDMLTITEQGGSVTYDYPNELEKVTYTITVTGKSDGKEDSQVLTDNIDIIHTPTALATVPTSPDVENENVLSILSDGNALSAYTNSASNVVFDGGTAQYIAALVGDNNAAQYSKLSATIGKVSFDEITIADAFASGESADSLHIDLHSIHSIGLNKVKISLGGKTYEQDLEDNEWTAFDIDLSDEGITSINEIVFELGSDGVATDEATLNVDNIYLHRVSLSVPSFTIDSNANDYSVTFTDASELAVNYSWDFGDGSEVSEDQNPTHEYADDGEESTYTVTLTTTNESGVSTSTTMDVIVGVFGSINPEVVKGDFERLNGDSSDDGNIRGAWKIAGLGNSNPFGTSSDGSCTDYEGTLGSKTRGAKWSSSQSAADLEGTVNPGNTRYAYQAFNLTPNTEYVLEYGYAIRTGGDGEDSMVATILNGHFDDSESAVASIPLVRHVGTIANGKFGDNSCSGGTTMKLPFRSNANGEVSILFYAVTSKDAYIDNVKLYPAE